FVCRFHSHAAGHTTTQQWLRHVYRAIKSLTRSKHHQPHNVNPQASGQDGRDPTATTPASARKRPGPWSPKRQPAPLTRQPTMALAQPPPRP
ncbi:hypothetical protein CPB85DRAFT_1330088, partial [Mucidula mucida]